MFAEQITNNNCFMLHPARPRTAVSCFTMDKRLAHSGNRFEMDGRRVKAPATVSDIRDRIAEFKKLGGMKVLFVSQQKWSALISFPR
jgi:hypothetical protein